MEIIDSCAVPVQKKGSPHKTATRPPGMILSLLELIHKIQELTSGWPNQQAHGDDLLGGHSLRDLTHEVFLSSKQ